MRKFICSNPELKAQSPLLDRPVPPLRGALELVEADADVLDDVRQDEPELNIELQVRAVDDV